MKLIRNITIGFFVLCLLPVFALVICLGNGSDDSSSISQKPPGTGNVIAGDFASPVGKGFKISSEVGYRPLDGFHYGMDFVMFYGAELYAITDAKVIFTNDTCAPKDGFYGNTCPNKGPNPWGGNSILLEFVYKDITYYAGYLHMQDVNVKVNDIVKKGQLIGHQGNSGNSTGSHLHLEIHHTEYKISSKPNLVDPRSLIKLQD